jgi:hypothetical protein
VYGVAGLSEESAGVVYTLFRDVLREGRLDEVVTVPAYAVDAQAEKFLFSIAPVQFGGVGASLAFASELVT